MDELILSICTQLQSILTSYIKEYKAFNPLKNGDNYLIDFLQQNFKVFDLVETQVLDKVLAACDKFVNKLIVIIIDDLDVSQLISWLPRKLLSIVKIVLSVKSMFGDIESYKHLYHLKESIKYFNAHHVELLLINKEENFGDNYKSGRRNSRKSLTVTTETFIKMFLKKHKKILAAEQMQVLLHTVNHCPYPVVVDLCVAIANSWTSYTPSKEILKIMPTSGYTLKDFFINFINIMKNDFGSIFVESCLAYIAISKNGVSHFEMIELLARNKELVDNHCKLYKDKYITYGDKRSCPSSTHMQVRCNAVPEITKLWYKLFDKLKVVLRETYTDENYTLKLKHDIYRVILTEMLVQSNIFY